MGPVLFIAPVFGWAHEIAGWENNEDSICSGNFCDVAMSHRLLASVLAAGCLHVTIHGQQRVPFAQKAARVRDSARGSHCDPDWLRQEM